MSPLAQVLFFAALNEAIIEYLFGSVQVVRPYLPLLSLAVAILLSFGYQLNAISAILGIQSQTPFFDYLLSGFIISRGSNFVNDFVQKFLGSK